MNNQIKLTAATLPSTTLAETRTATWDKIGTDISAATTLSDALVKAKLDFTVTKLPLYTTKPGDDALHNIPTHAACVGSDGKVRGVVRSTYGVINNADAFTLAEALHDEGNLEYVRGGETYKGMSYLIMALPQFKVLDDDMKLYFILQNSFAGQQSLKAAIAPLRIVCQNQFRLAFREANNTIAIRHTRSAPDRLEQARQMLGYAGQYIGELQKYAEKLVAVKITPDQLNAFIDAMFPYKSIAAGAVERTNVLRTDFMRCYKAVDLGNFTGTAWGLLNAWQDFETHTEGFRPKPQAADFKFMHMVNAGSNEASQVLHQIISVAA